MSRDALHWVPAWGDHPPRGRARTACGRKLRAVRGRCATSFACDERGRCRVCWRAWEGGR